MIKKMLLLTLVLTLVLVGCSSPTTTQEQGETETTTPTTIATTTEKELADSEIISVLKNDFAYGESADLVVAGKAVKGEQIGDTGIFYAATGNAPTGVLYAVTAMPYYEYYAAELGIEGSDQYAETSPAEALKVIGEYDAITSATSLEGSHAKDYPAILDYTPGTDLGTNPLKFTGIKTVDVAVDAKLYVEGMILAKATGEKYALAKAVSKLQFEDDANAPAYNNNVKTLSADGLFGPCASAANGVQPIDLATLELSSEVDYDSQYGNYIFKVRFNGFDKENENAELYMAKYLDNVYAVTLEDSKGNIAGAIYYQDIWSEKSHDFLEVAVSSGEIDSKKNKFTVSRYDKMFTPGTIDLPIGQYTMTIKSRGYTDLISELTVGTRLSEAQAMKIEDQDWSKDGNVLKVDTNALPEDFAINTYKLLAGYRNYLEEGVGYNFDQDKMELTVKNVEDAGINGYRFILIDEKYQPAEANFVLKSTMRADQLTFDGEKLVMAKDSPITLVDYLAKVGRAYISEVGKEDAKPNRIRFSRANIFNDDFTFNPAATYRDKPLFEAGKNYTIKLTATGFEDVELTGFEVK
ncbi:MAG: hypothetical protein CSA13_00640 [Clostridiales bacterium]|nr:MAG: hypothetical protein CSA13_00640 [Clostridiales bacterium]